MIDKDKWVLSKNNTVRKVPFFKDGFVVVYPNPFADKVFVWLDGTVIQSVSYEIFSITGAVLQSGNTVLNGDLLEINTTTLPKGSYVLKIKYNQQVKNVKVVKN